MREIIFDTETTGFDPASGDRMVEIGCIEMINRVTTDRVFHAYFNPERSMPPGAQDVHGLSSAFLADKPLFAEQADALLSFLGDAPLVAHNASFDFGFLNAELKLSGRPAIAMDRMVDTLAMAKIRYPGSPASLDALCKRYGVDRSRRVKHGALLDSELLAQVYVELTGGRQIGLSLTEQHAQTHTGSGLPGSPAPIDRQRLEPRPHSASADELDHHRAFIADIEDSVWSRMADQ